MSNNTDWTVPQRKESQKTMGFTTSSWKVLMWWNTEDWWPCWIGFVFFGCVVGLVQHGIPQPGFEPWLYNPFDAFANKANLGLLVLFVAMGCMVWLAASATRLKSWRMFPAGYAVVFLIALVSKVLAANTRLKIASLGDSIWAIIFGTVLRNILTRGGANAKQPLPPWLKVAQQTELYIAISLVLLCIDFTVLKPLAPRALFVSWLDTPTLFLAVAWIGHRFLGIDLQTSIIMSGATFICGSSAAIALGASMGALGKADMPIAIISVFTIPSIIALPYIADGLHFSAEVAGAWFGGCVDSTGAVIAAATIYNDKDAINTAAVVKMMQNVLIGPLSVLMALGWSRRELRMAREEQAQLLELEEAGQAPHEGFHVSEPMPSSKDDAYRVAEHNHDASSSSSSPFSNANKKTSPRNAPAKQPKPWVLLWRRFPKFVFGFIVTAVLFNTTVSDANRTNVNNFCFYIGEWFSTLSFVSIGLGLQFFELKRDIRLVGKLCTLYTIAQLVDIIITALLAWIAFDLL
ncbi:hypothetical protein BZG36_01027 [Bifiguratus adelaidae]|uniref:Sulfate exporter family transporter n=1 Tax=Bifiguratus adelaidae TaxID=1938954 RepID=A0A261Y6E3_9FUNG|nr:hypothetical protein BZG36_01027 [Bifiguratus adelaidae]